MNPADAIMRLMGKSVGENVNTSQEAEDILAIERVTGVPHPNRAKYNLPPFEG